MKIFFTKNFGLPVALFFAVCGFFVSNQVSAIPWNGDPVTGLDVPDNVLQLNETTTATATTTEEGARNWNSSDTDIATVGSDNGIVEAIAAGTVTIAYTASDSGQVNGTSVTIYAAPITDDPLIGEALIGRGDVVPTDYTEAEFGTSTISWLSSDTDVATIDITTGVITPVEEGTTTISYFVEETATGRIVARGSLEITVDDPIGIMFDSISEELEEEDIVSNLDTVTSFNYTSFSGLYFEKWLDGEKMGRITFNSALDLSDDDTTDFLQALGTKLEAASIGTIGLDFTGTTDSVALKETSATIKFYGLDELGFSDSATSEQVSEKLIAFDDEGNLLDISDLAPVQGTYVGACGVGEDECHMFTVDVNHFTTYEIDNIAPDNQDEVFPNSMSKRGGSSVGVVSANEEGGAIWFAPFGTTSFVAGSDMTTAGGTATSIDAPTASGSYRLYVIDAAGNVSDESDAVLTVSASGGSGNGHSSGSLVAGSSGGSAENDPAMIARLQSLLDSLIAQIRMTVRTMIAQGKPVPPAAMAFVQGGTAKITQTWSLGMSGEEVRIIQTILAQDPTVYPEAKITGYFGPLTLAAVKKFQIKYGIANPGESGYGIVGPITRAKMNGM